MKVVAFLPVKGTSSRIENKNIKLLDGKPLFIHTLDKLLKCDFIDEVYLDSESETIFNLASDYDCFKIKRDAKLASNATDGNTLFYNECSKVNGDIYIQILCTSPFIEIKTIEKGVNILKENSKIDSIVLVKREKLYTWNNNKTNYDINKIPNSIDLPDTIIETMGLYMTKKETVMSYKKRVGKFPFLLDATPTEAIDVNFPEDFKLANLIAAGIRESERKLLTNLSKQLSSSMISDVLDELGIENKVIQGFKLNINNKKVFGRAKTLRIRKKREGDLNTIYDALETYETIVPNDIIVVENELEHLAYFGELNANLSIRSGAIAAIIGGNTRDFSEVKSIDFPVFAKGNNCKDIKNEGVLDYYNKTITIEGVKVSYEDLIFGDSDGIVIIPKQRESEVLNLCFITLKKEKQILTEVANGKSATQIRNEYGNF